MRGRQTHFDKVWKKHIVAGAGDRSLLYVDLHLIFEGTSREAFAGLDLKMLSVRRPELTLGTVDHFSPSRILSLGAMTPEIRMYLETFEENCRRHRVPHFGYRSRHQGIVHLIGPELGLTQPGMSIVCGDSHTSTHGAFGALAIGIGSTQVQHVLATQTVLLKRPRQMRLSMTGRLGAGVGSKDLALAAISRFGNLAAVGHALEFTGDAVRAMSVESRMTLCNMGTELGASASIMVPDEKIFTYLGGRPGTPSGRHWDDAVAEWTGLGTDEDARFDRELHMDVSEVRPTVSWGTLPSQVAAVDGVVPSPDTDLNPAAAQRALEYMGLRPGQPLRSVPIDAAFIGSCTNGRIEDLRIAAAVLRTRRIAVGVRGFVVPGSAQVKKQAESEGIHLIFQAAGMEWREPSCSFCAAVNGDTVEPGQRIVSTSNRNFEGRQGPRVRTHLASPAVVAASAVAGHLCGPEDLDEVR